MRLASIALCSEVKIFCLGGVDDGLHGFETRVGDRGRRQPGVDVGVKRMSDRARIKVEGGPPVRRSRNGILSRRVGVESHIDLESIQKHAGDDRPLFIFHRFAFDD